MLETAKRICKEAHAGQVDKGGKDYYLHPFAVADMCETDDEKVAAYLHDVLEDTSVTAADLAAQGIPQRIIDALEALTHKPGENYFDYIERAKSNPIARAVKIKDLIHNSDLSRLKEITPKDLARVEKYKKCIEILQGT